MAWIETTIDYYSLHMIRLYFTWVWGLTSHAERIMLRDLIVWGVKVASFIK